MRRTIHQLIATLAVCLCVLRVDACFNGAVDACMVNATLPPNACEMWKCVQKKCVKSFVNELVQQRCAEAPRKWKGTPTTRTDLVGVPEVNSPCLHVKAAWTEDQIRAHLLDISMDVYKGRASEHYTEGNERWIGIDNHVCAPSVPTYSDCSSTVTWIYWNLFGSGADFLNGESWKAGYTGTLVTHGSAVKADVNSLLVGDLCFYYTPMHHVAIYVGGGKVVSHGMDPVGYYPYNYAPLDYCRRYI